MSKRKWIKLASVMLAATTVLLSAAACGGKSEETETAQAGTFVINDFSSTLELYQLIPKNFFGNISWNQEKKYVLTGNGSAKLEPDMNATAEPYFKQRLTSEDFDYNHGDLTMVTNISAQIYNASDADVTMQSEIEFSKGEKSPRETVTLKAGQWNTVTYKVYPELLGLRFNTKEAAYVNYYVTRKAMAQQPVLYMDNVSISYTDEAPEPISLDLEKGELCSFDRNYQAFMPYLVGWGNYLQEVTEMTLSANPKYTVGGTGCSYKVKSVASDSKQSYFVYIPKNLCQAAGLNKVTNKDKLEFYVYSVGGNMRQLTVQIRYEIKLKNGTSKETFAPTFYDESYYSGQYGTGWAYDSVELTPDDWTKVSIDFGELEKTTRLALAANAKTYELNCKPEEYDVLGSLTEVTVAWGSFSDVPEKVFYLDDMKIVKGN